MGVFDLLKPDNEAVASTRSALEAARDGEADDSAIGRVVQILLNAGVDGIGPLSSAQQMADEAEREVGSSEAAVGRVGRKALIGGAVGGFATGLGGFITMPVALPINVLEFYVQATRMVGAIASLRGYDIDDPQIRTAILLTMVGSEAEDVLEQAGVSTGASRATNLAFSRLPPAALMMVNKAVGFRLLRGVGAKLFSRLGRAVPVLGGAVGGGFDAFMMKKIADHAMLEFPRVS